MRMSELAIAAWDWALAAVCGLQPGTARIVVASSAMLPLMRRMVLSSPLEAENPDQATLAGVSPDILVRIRRRAYVGGIVRPDIPREQEPVAADPRIHRDILLPVSSTIRDRVAD